VVIDGYELLAVDNDATKRPGNIALSFKIFPYRGICSNEIVQAGNPRLFASDVSIKLVLPLVLWRVLG